MYIQTCDYCGTAGTEWWGDTAVCHRCLRAGVHAAVERFGSLDRAQTYATFPIHHWYYDREETRLAVLQARFRPARHDLGQDALF